MPELDDLVREFETLGVGPQIDKAVRDLTAQVARSYPPSVYARTPTWTADAIEDLAQDITTDWLIGDRQLSYILTVAHDMSEFRKLLANIVKRALARRRVRTVVDNLLERCRPLLEQEPFETITIGGRKVYRQRGAPPYSGDPSDSQIRTAERLVAKIPRLPPGTGDRAPIIYTAAQLEQLLLAVASNLPSGFRIRDLDRILHRVLTAWLASALVADEVLSATPSPELSPEDTVLVHDITARLLNELRDDQRTLLRLYLIDASDAEIGSVFGKTRQTILKRRKELAETIGRHLNGVSPRVADTVVRGLVVALGTSGGGSGA